MTAGPSAILTARNASCYGVAEAVDTNGGGAVVIELTFSVDSLLFLNHYPLSCPDY